MRWLVLLLTLSGCAFQVTGVPGIDPVPAGPVDDPGTSSVPPATSTNPPISVTDPTLPDLGDGAGPGTPPLGIIGDACDDKKAPCSAGLLCLRKGNNFTPDIPGGYCSLDCRTAPCPAGSVCSTQFGTTRVCLASCPPATCRTGYVCCRNGNNPGPVCLPGALCGD